MKNGKIIKAISGFYYVACENLIYECKPRGTFRNDKISPLVGDFVSFTPDGDKGTLESVSPRKNQFIRPPVANIDQFILVVSSVKPLPNYFVIDKLVSIAQHKGVEVVFAFTKTDLSLDLKTFELYSGAGFTCILIDYETPNFKEQMFGVLKDKTTIFVGNSGVGKSTLLNHLNLGLDLKTAQISEKLGRGRHTTRHVQLYTLPFGGFVADTPGFSDIDLHLKERILKDDLADTFREFAPFLNGCKFNDCSHTKELGCGVLKAVQEGHITKSRHDSYVALYNDLKNVQTWNLNEKER